MSTSSSGRQPPAGRRESPFSLFLITSAVVIAAAAAVALYSIYEDQDVAEQKALAVEAGKTLMQVIGVVLLGAVFSYAASAISLRYQNGMSMRQLLHTSAEAERVRQHSEWLRKVDEQKDQRRRLDDLHRTLLDATIANYNAVKRCRRHLRAEGYRGPNAGTGSPEKGSDTVAVTERAHKVFVGEFERLIEIQLEFERLAKQSELATVAVGPKQDTAPETSEERGGQTPPGEPLGEPLPRVYEDCASYLKRVIGDYVDHVVPPPGPQTAEHLGGFLAQRDEGGFRTFSDTTKAAMRALRQELTQPLAVEPEGRFLTDSARFAERMDEIETVMQQLRARNVKGSRGVVGISRHAPRDVVRHLRTSLARRQRD